MRIKRIQATNYVTYQSLDLPIPEGITVIRGTNGHGKSIIGGVIPAIFYGQTLTSRPSKTTNKIQTRSGGILSVVGDRLGIPFVAERISGSSTTFNLQQDGYKQSWGSREGQPRMAKFMGLSQDIYFSAAHLTTYRVAPLLNGSVEQRRAFFEKIFNDAIFDKIYAELVVQQRDMKAKRVALETAVSMEKEIAARRCDVSQEEVSRVKATLDTEREALARSEKEYDRAQQALATAEHLAPLLERLALAAQASQQNEAHSVENLEDLERGLAAADEAVRYIENRNSALAHVGDYRAAVDVIRDIERRASPFDFSLEDHTEERAVTARRLAGLEEFRRKLTLIINHPTPLPFWDLVHSLEQAGLPSDPEGMAAVRNKYSQMLGFIEDHDVCPLCGGDSRHAKEKVTRLLALLNEGYMETIRICHPYLDILREELYVYGDVRIVADAEIQKADRQIKSLQQRLIEMDGRRAEMDQYWSAQKIVQAAQDVRAAWPDPQETLEAAQHRAEDARNRFYAANRRLQKKAEHQDAMRALNDALAEHDQAMRVLSDYCRAAGADLSWYRDDLLKSFREIVAHKEDIARLEADYMAMYSDWSASKNTTETIESIRAKISAFESATQDAPIIDSLVRAYSKAGVRATFVEDAARTMEALMNEQAALLFQDRFRFIFDVSPGKFNLLAERSSGIDDVASSLSGAETRFFNLLVMACTLPLLPEEIRPQTVVLDEVENGMSEINQTRIIREFMPHLLTLVKSVLYITPKGMSELPIPDAFEYRVRKNSGVSFLEPLNV